MERGEKVGQSPRKFSDPHQFDYYCKLVLEHEATDYLREMDRRRSREISLDTLSQAEMEQLCTVDHYPSDSYVFSSHGCDLPINNELVAAAFGRLPKQEQSILILHLVLNLSDGKIGELIGMSRSAVQRHRVNTLSILRKKLAALMPEGS